MYGLVTIPELSTGENYMYTLVLFPVVVVVFFFVVVMQLMLLCITPQKYGCIGD